MRSRYTDHTPEWLKKAQRKNRIMRKLVVGIIVIAAVTILAGPFLGIFSPDYSEGDRVGTITKFSKKGFFFKSWEGELVMGGFKNVTTESGSTAMAANVFEFSVKDQNVVEKIQEAMETGKSVELHYTEKMWAPITQSTSYEITDVKVLNK